jgi:hypothetical protein
MTLVLPAKTGFAQDWNQNGERILDRTEQPISLPKHTVKLSTVAVQQYSSILKHLLTTIRQTDKC